MDVFFRYHYKGQCCLQWAEVNTYFTEDDLWCQVFWGPAKCPSPALYPFRKSKICYL